jgi:hypothetical protein
VLTRARARAPAGKSALPGLCASYFVALRGALAGRVSEASQASTLEAELNRLAAKLPFAQVLLEPWRGAPARPRAARRRPRPRRRRRERAARGAPGR